MRRFSSVFVACMVAGAFGQVGASDSPELQRYVEEARTFGMGEAARMTLRTVASITTGGSSLSFTKDPSGDGYSRSYQSTSCPPRGADSLALRRWKSEISARLDTEIRVLREIADSDSSGFVTPFEAASCRELIEFGYFVAFLTDHGIVLASEIARAAQVDESVLTARVEKYNSAAARINAGRHGALETKLPLVRLGA